MTYPFEMTLTSGAPEVEIDEVSNTLIAAMIAQEAASVGDCVDCQVQEIPQIPAGGSFLTGVTLSSDLPVAIEIGYLIPDGGDVFVPVYSTMGLLGTECRFVHDEFTDGIPLEIDGTAEGRRLAIRRSGSAEVSIVVAGALEFYKRGG